MRKIIGLLFVCCFFSPSVFAQTNYSLRLNGNGIGDIDRVKIPIDSPQTLADIGDTDFTVEWWMKATTAENSASGCSTGNDGWITGNILFDRDILGGGDYGDFGISFHSGKPTFGVNNGSTGMALCGVTNVMNNIWHHVAVSRRLSDGRLSIFVDGKLDSTADGPDGNISYRNGRTGAQNDPYLVIGAEKHDYDPSNYPSYRGLIDEVRISRTIRYANDFSPQYPLSTDTETTILYRFDEGSGVVALDAAGNVNGQVKIGGNPSGPVWTTDVPSACLSSLVGDANCDRAVNGLDYVIWITNYGTTTISGQRKGDFNNDTKINGLDYVVWLSNYGRSELLSSSR